MKRVESIVSIPKFIEKYISVNKFENSIVHDFCKLLMETELEDIDLNKEGHHVFTFAYNTSYTFTRFLNFYFSKSKLDIYFQCEYENELEMSKSLLNELFVIEYNGNVFTVYISSYDNGKLKLTSA